MKNVNILSLKSVNTYFAATLIYELCKTPYVNLIYPEKTIL